MTRTPKHLRRCASCNGLCDWHDEAWVCRRCGDEWYPDHGDNYAPDDEAADPGVEPGRV